MAVDCVGGRFFFASRRRHTRCSRDWSSDVCSSDLIAWTAAFVRRNVEIRAGGKIARSRAAIGRKDKQVAALALVPVGPVAVKKVLGDVGLHLVLFFFFIALFVAVVVFAVGIYRRGKRNRFPVGRPLHETRAGR